MVLIKKVTAEQRREGGRRKKAAQGIRGEGPRPPSKTPAPAEAWCVQRTEPRPRTGRARGLGKEMRPQRWGGGQVLWALVATERTLAFHLVTGQPLQSQTDRLTRSL